MSAIRDGNEAFSDEIDLYAYMETLWRHRWLLVWLVVIAVGVAAAISLWAIPPTYEATSLVQLAQGDLSLGSPETYRGFALSSSVLARVAQAVGVDEAAITQAVMVEIVPNSSVLRLRVQSDASERARAIGDVWVKSFLTEVQSLWEKRLDGQFAMEQARLEGMRKSLDSLLQPAHGESGNTARSNYQIVVPGDFVVASGELSRLEQLRTQVTRGELNDVTVVMPFRAEPKPVSPRTALNVSVAGLLAAMAGVFGVFAVEGWRSRRGAME